ncbi:hypothetical protein LTR28_004578 [Elasticomyces elasticus]|nr:hypothetical protein LTR28_004578 [Elasticomyces elasticus]
MSASKISCYSLPDLHNTTNDALPNYLTSLKFTQSHSSSNIRLAIGYAAVLISAATFYFDWTLGFEKTKYWTGAAVAVYFALNGAFTWWYLLGDEGLVFEGTREGRKTTTSRNDKGPGTHADTSPLKLKLLTHTKPHTPTYFLRAQYTTSPSKNSAPLTYQDLKLEIPYTRFFTADGHFVAKPFQQWLASAVPIVGDADPNNVVEEIGRGSDEGAETVRASALEAVMSGMMEQAGSATDRAGGGKRRKKA